MLNRLMKHRAWASRIILDWCFVEAKEDAYILKIMSHILLGESAWLNRLRSEKVLANTWGILEPTLWPEKFEENELGWLKIQSGDLNRNVQYYRLNGDPSESTVQDILTHVCTHGMYHRGQVTAQAARLGKAPPATDFILYSRLPEASV